MRKPSHTAHTKPRTRRGPAQGPIPQRIARSPCAWAQPQCRHRTDHQCHWNHWINLRIKHQASWGAGRVPGSAPSSQSRRTAESTQLVILARKNQVVMANCEYHFILGTDQVLCHSGIEDLATLLFGLLAGPFVIVPVVDLARQILKSCVTDWWKFDCKILTLHLLASLG